MIRNAFKAAIAIFLFAIFTFPVHAETTSKKRSAKKPAVVKSASTKTAATKAKRPAKAKSAKTSKAGKSAVLAKTKASSGQKARTARSKARKTPTVTVSKKTVRTASLNTREKTVRKVIIKNGKRKVIYQRVPAQVVAAVPPVLTAGDLAGLHLTQDALALESNVALVTDQLTGRVLFEKNAHVPLPIASITKLMTALVVVEARQNMQDILEVTVEDIDRERHSGSRLRIGSQLTRDNMLRIALMSSENRAASALGRHYPGGINAFVAAMNAKAKSLGMAQTRFADATGLSSQNTASASDITKLVLAAYKHPVLGQYSTGDRYTVNPGSYTVEYANSNRLVSNADWEIGLQKTGYISEAGRCLAMQARIEGRPVIMVFLDSKGRYSRLADAGRVRKWLGTPPAQDASERQVAVASPKM